MVPYSVLNIAPAKGLMGITGRAALEHLRPKVISRQTEDR